MKLNAQLHMRRRQLVSELMSIYPIVEVRNRKAVNGKMILSMKQLQNTR